MSLRIWFGGSRECEIIVIDKEKSASHFVENPSFQYMYHFVSAYLCLHWLARKRKSCMEQIGSTSEKDEWRWTREWKPYKMALGKRQLTLSSCQDRCSTKWLWDFRLFYHIMNALVWSFFDKIVKIFVDQNRWQALPFCRAMVYGQTIL